MSATLLSGGTVITMNPDRDVIENGVVVVADDTIVDVGSSAHLHGRYPEAEHIDCTDRVVIPGLVNTHTHLFQTLLKGLGDDMPLEDWFVEMTGPSAAHLTRTDVYAAARHGAVEAIKSGTTTIADFMYVHPVERLTDEVIRALSDVGIRGLVGRGYMTTGRDVGVPRNLIEDASGAINDAVRLIRAHNGEGSLVRVGLAPTMIWTVDRATLARTRAAADAERAMVMMHVSETTFEIDHAIARFGGRDVEVLAAVGLLGPDLLAVHCVQCDDADIDVLAEHDVKVSHNPCSNLYLASGFAPVPQMLRSGLTVGLGSDGPASNNNHNLIGAMKFAALIHKGFARDAEVITAETVLEMATIEGARALGMDHEIGSLEVGKKADLVVLDFDNFFLTPAHNPVSALVYSAIGDEPDTVMINGRIVMADGTMRTVDETEVRMEAERCAEQLSVRAGTTRLRRRAWRSASRDRRPRAHESP